MWKFWLIVAGISFVIESFTVGFLVFWFGIGALVSLIVSLFISNFFVQAIIFIIVSSLLLIFTKPLVNKMIKEHDTFPTNVHSIIGKEGIVVENINATDNLGKVKVNGELWTATSDTPIEKNAKVKIIKVDGVKLEVTELSKVSDKI